MFECIIDEGIRSIRKREREDRWPGREEDEREDGGTGGGQDGEKTVQIPACCSWQKSLKKVHRELCKARKGCKSRVRFHMF